MKKDYNILLENEKVFEEYRQITKNIEKLKKVAIQTEKQINNLIKDRYSIQKLIETIIKHNCDPTEAKLKYGKELSIIDDIDIDELDFSLD